MLVEIRFGLWTGRLATVPASAVENGEWTADSFVTGVPVTLDGLTGTFYPTELELVG